MQEIVKKIHFLLKRLNDHNRNTNTESIKIKLPGGIISTVDNYTRSLPYITNDILQRNISYHLMLDDVFIWFLNHFAFYAVVKEMIVKIAIANLGNIMEAIVQFLAKNISNNHSKRITFNKIYSHFCAFLSLKRKQKKRNIGIRGALSTLTHKNIIEKSLKKEVLWVWGIRCKQHIESLKKREYNVYSTDDYKKAIIIWNKLNKQLNSSCENEQIEGKENIRNVIGFF